MLEPDFRREYHVDLMDALNDGVSWRWLLVHIGGLSPSSLFYLANQPKTGKSGEPERVIDDPKEGEKAIWGGFGLAPKNKPKTD